MSSQQTPGDLTLLGQWKLGDQDAASEFHRRYVEKLLSLVQANIARRFSTRFDACDVVQSVMRTFFGAAADGRLKAGSSDEVWKLLQTIALNKVRNQVKFHDAQKRRVAKSLASDVDLQSIGDPTDRDAVEVTDLIEAMIRSLDPKVARTMCMILEGRSQDEISTELNVTTRSVRRYRDQIAEQLKGLIEP